MNNTEKFIEENAKAKALMQGMLRKYDEKIKLLKHAHDDEISELEALKRGAKQVYKIENEELCKKYIKPASREIKGLQAAHNLHRVFTGIIHTPKQEVVFDTEAAQVNFTQTAEGVQFVINLPYKEAEKCLTLLIEKK